MGSRRVLVAVVLAVGCASPTTAPLAAEANEVVTVPVMLNGAVEKGPFLLGSSVSVTPSAVAAVATEMGTAMSAARASGEPAGDPAGNSSGRVFRTETSNDRGEFAVSVDFMGPATIEGTGYYYNEATGLLSKSMLTLRAFHDVEADASVYVNLVTHLTYQRVQHLVGTGVEAAVAVEQAEGELYTSLGIGAPSVSGSELNLGGGNNDDAAYLFAVSTLFAQAARIDDPSNVDARLQEMLNTTSTYFAENGAVPAAVVSKLENARLRTNNETVMAALRARFEATGSTAEVPDLNRILPWTMPADVTVCAENVLSSESLECRLAVCGASARPSTRTALENDQKAMSSEVCGEECWAASRCAVQQCTKTSDSGAKFLDTTCASASCGVGFVEGSPTRLWTKQAEIIFEAAKSGDCK